MRHRILIAAILLTGYFNAFTQQRIGIGTDSPIRTLDVTGTLNQHSHQCTIGNDPQQIVLILFDINYSLTINTFSIMSATQTQSLFDRIGGINAVNAAVDIFYER